MTPFPILLSIVTVVKDERDQLRSLVEGLCASLPGLVSVLAPTEF